MACPKNKGIYAPRNSSLAERLAHRSRASVTGCILWVGARTSTGYGKIKYRGEWLLVHRASWAVANGEPAPPRMFVCHRCDTPLCINSEHLFLGTAVENNADRHSKGRTSRVQGERHGQAKLTKAQILEIRSAQGIHREIAARYAVHRSTIGDIKRRKSWQSVADDGMY